MEHQELFAVMAVLHFEDNRIAGDRKLRGFTNKKTFEEFIDLNPGHIFYDDVLVITQGGGHRVATIEEVRLMNWIMETE